MKKTVIVNISGIIFHIDEDAYEKLNAYIAALHKYFDSQSEGKEIVSDIETRVAELLQPKISEAKQSVTLEDIEEVISILGKPEDIADSEGGATKRDKEQSSTSSKIYSRRLHRDPDNAILGGVCSGMAAYFRIDPVFLRLLFIALCFAAGTSVIIYIILWIVVPQAVTSAQKLQMRGEEVNINNIERTYQVGYSSNSLKDKGRSFLNEVVEVIGKFFRILGRVIAVLFGIFLILISITFIISLLSIVFFNNFIFDEFVYNQSLSLREFLSPIIDTSNIFLLLIVLIIIAVIPLIGLIYAGLKILIRFKAKDKWAILSLSLLWIAAVVFAVILIFRQVGNFRKEDYTKEVVVLLAPKNNTLYLRTPNLNDKHNVLIKLSHSSLYGMEIKNGKKELFGVNKIDIKKSLSTSPELEIVREARGRTYEEALKAASQIKVMFVQTDSVLNIEPAFRLLQSDAWRFQSSKVILRIPVGMKVYLDESSQDFLHNIDNLNGYWTGDMAGKTWQMTENGLELIKLSSIEKHNLKTTNQFYLQVRDRFSIPEHKLRYHEFGYQEFEGKTYNYRAVNFQVKRSEDKVAFLQIERKVPFVSQTPGNSILNSITFKFEQKDSILWIDPVFLFPKDIKQSDQEVNLTLYLPIHSRIFISENIRHLMRDDYEHLADKYLMMTLEGLKEIDEKKETNN